MDKDEILFIFDGLIVDYALMKYNIHGDEFKSTLSKHDVLNDESVKSYLNTVVNKLHELNEKFWVLKAKHSSLLSAFK